MHVIFYNSIIHNEELQNHLNLLEWLSLKVQQMSKWLV